MTLAALIGGFVGGAIVGALAMLYHYGRSMRLLRKAYAEHLEAQAAVLAKAVRDVRNLRYRILAGTTN